MDICTIWTNIEDALSSVSKPSLPKPGIRMSGFLENVDVLGLAFPNAPVTAHLTDKEKPAKLWISSRNGAFNQVTDEGIPRRCA